MARQMIFKPGEWATQRVVALGTGAVATQTVIVAVVPQNMMVESIKFAGQGAVTGTTITAEVFARTKAGAAGNTLQSAVTDVKFTTIALAKAGVSAALNKANCSLLEGQLIEVVITCTAITGGTGDFNVKIGFTPKYNRG